VLDSTRAGSRPSKFLAATDLIEPFEADDIADAYVTMCVLPSLVGGRCEAAGGTGWGRPWLSERHP
jgi:hypothetical protein